MLAGADPRGAARGPDRQAAGREDEDPGRDTCRRSSPHRPRSGCPSYAKGNAEGFLFPATYDVAPGEDATSVLKAMVHRFAQAEPDTEPRPRARADVHLTPYQVLVVASIVQAEGRTEDFPKIARAILNRLDDGHEAAAQQHGQLRAEERQGEAVHGRHRHPVAVQHVPARRPAARARSTRPGEDAINAVLAPAAGNWLYWVTVDPKTGETKFTNSYAGVPAVQGRAEGERRMRAAVLGSPVAHSLSPVLHRAAYAHLGLRLDATTRSSATSADLAGFVASLGPEWAGLSLTMPLKAAVLRAGRRGRRGRARRGGREHAGAAGRPAGRPRTPTSPAWSRRWPSAARPRRRRRRQRARRRRDGAVGRGVAGRGRLVAPSTWSARRPEAAAGPGRHRCAPPASRSGCGGWDAAGELLGARPGRLDRPGRGGRRPRRRRCRPAPGTLFDVLYHPWPTPLATRLGGGRRDRGRRARPARPPGRRPGAADDRVRRGRRRRWSR